MHDARSNLSERRNAIECELRERLRRAGVRPAQTGNGPAAPPVRAEVALACVECGGTSPADARFCTRCGVRFNALVVGHASRVLASLVVAAGLLFHASTSQALQQTGTPPLLSTRPVPMAGTSAQPGEMSGLPLQVSDLPPGTVAVRVIRVTFSDNIAHQRVDLAVGPAGRTLSATTDPDGRAVFQGLSVGEMVRAKTTVDGETIVSQFFELPSQGGVRVILVAGAGAPRADTTSTAPPAPDPPIGSSRHAGAAVAGSLFALVALTVGVSVSRNRRLRSRSGDAPAVSPEKGRSARREALFERLVQLEREHESGALSDGGYNAAREPLIGELLRIDER